MTNTSLLVQWNNRTSYEGFERIHLNVKGPNFTMNVNVSSDTSTYTITGLTPGMVYDILCFVSNDSVPSLQNISLSAYTSKYTLFKSAHTTELYTGFEVFF